MSMENPPDGIEIDATILTCPAENCSRKIVGDSAAMANHVRNSEDEAHRWMILDEDGGLKSTFDWR